MRSAVRAAFIGFSTRFESFLPFMYLDVRGFVTTGVGNLIDDPASVCALPWMLQNGAPANRGEILAEWSRVRARKDLALLGGGHFAPPVTTLHLSPAAVTALVLSKLDANERLLRGRFFGEWDLFCADAQLGTHSIAWAVGAAFHFPRFEAAMRARDFANAAAECHLDETGNGGLIPRNAANRALFTNAAAVERLGLDPEVLYWPGEATVTNEPGPPSTVPEGPAAA